MTSSREIFGIGVWSVIRLCLHRPLGCRKAALGGGIRKAYPTEADVWKHARLSGLVVDVATEDDKPTPRPVLDNDYEIKPCRPDPQEDPAKNQAEAEREAELEFQLNS
jgi:hypothetical protein